MYLITWITTHLPTTEGWMADGHVGLPSGRLNHKVVTRPASSLAQDRESSPAKTCVLTTDAGNQRITLQLSHCSMKWFISVYFCFKRSTMWDRQSSGHSDISRSWATVPERPWFAGSIIFDRFSSSVVVIIITSPVSIAVMCNDSVTYKYKVKCVQVTYIRWYTVSPRFAADTIPMHGNVEAVRPQLSYFL